MKEIKSDEGNIKQLMILTHNVYFHKEASFIDGRNSKNNNTHFWILRKKGKYIRAPKLWNGKPNFYII